MSKEIKVFQVIHEIVRKVDGERIIFEKDDEDDIWVYKAPNAQKHNVEDLQIIIDKLKELNTESRNSTHLEEKK